METFNRFIKLAPGPLPEWSQGGCGPQGLRPYRARHEVQALQRDVCVGELPGVRILSEFCPDFVQILFLFFPDFFRILSGFFPDFVRILFGFCPDFDQILSRFCPDFVRILSGFCPDFVRILSGFCPDFVRILTGFCQLWIWVKKFKKSQNWHRIINLFRSIFVIKAVFSVAHFFSNIFRQILKKS
jgi:hypothetical protein